MACAGLRVAVPRPLAIYRTARRRWRGGRSTTIDALLWSWISMLQEMSIYKAGYLQHGQRFATAR
ncbi:hypothetical protein PSAB6_50172 [Paraburkholderia sabiae]|nr:hypothetical protein PSAB6_50172 [Paraburkholderia sabiae]